MLPNLKQYLKDPLRKNALFLMATNVLGSLAGFLFWLIAARFYSTKDVGLSTAIISAMMLISVFSRLGLDVGIVRFLPHSENKRDTINSCLTLSGLASALSATIFILGLRFWSPKLLVLQENWSYLLTFVLFAAVITLSQFQGQVFVAFRSAQFALIQSLINCFRLLLVSLMVGLGAFGIIASLGSAWSLAFIASGFFIVKLYPDYRPMPIIRKQVINDMARFSFGNYIANVFGALPTYTLPLIIISVLNTEASAFFYIPFSLISVLGMVTESATSSLLAEGSYEPEKLRKQGIKAMKFISMFLIPGVAILCIFGGPILSLFGADYVQNSLGLLRLLAISCIPWAVLNLYTTVLRVQLRVKPLIYLWGCFAVFTIAVSYWLMKWVGLNGVGIAWLSAQGVLAVVAGLKMLNMARISLRRLPKIQAAGD